MRPSSELCALAALALTACASTDGDVVGRVTWAGTARGEEIELTLLGPVTRATRTDAEGYWILRGLPPGEYAVVAEAADALEPRATTAVEVLERRQVEAEPLTLTAVGKISGVVTREGAASHQGTNLLVVGGAGSAETAADGAFVLDRIPAGRRDLLAWAPGFEQLRLEGVEVRRGETTALAPAALAPLESGSGPRLGTLRGRAWLPGTDDHAGIQVAVAGTALGAVTAADGSFEVGEVPNGIVAVSFRKGDAAADLGRVLVVAGSNGFIVDGGLYDLGRAPVLLRRGTRLIAKAGGVAALSPGGEWAVVQTGYLSHLWLVRRGEPPRRLTAPTGSFSSLGFSPGAAPTGYWFSSNDQKAAEYAIQRTELATATTRTFATLDAASGFRFAAGAEGAAWLDRRTVHLRASAEAPLVKRFDGKATGLATLDGETVLVAADGAVHEVRFDGTVRGTRAVSSGADWVVLSADRRWVVAGTGGYDSIPVAATAALLDRDRQTAVVLPGTCRSPQFSPESDALLCEDLLHRLGSAGVLSTVSTGTHYGSPWLPGGRVAVIYPPQVKILAAGQPDILLAGMTWESTTLFPTTDGKRVRLLANFDALSGLGQALEVNLADGAITVLAEGASTRPFLANDRGVVIGRPRTVGTDIDLVFVPVTGPEVVLGRTSRSYSLALASSAGGTFVSARRFAPGRGYESVVLDTRGGADPVLPISMTFGSDRWLDDRRLVQSVTAAAPFSETAGLYLVELP